MIVYIRPYEPTVECEAHPARVPSAKACDEALQLVPRYTRLDLWGTKEYAGPRIGHYQLPRDYEDGELPRSFAFKPHTLSRLRHCSHLREF